LYSRGNTTIEPVLPANRDEDGLLGRARRGDSSAFAALCEKHRHRVWRVVATVTKGGADTDDLAQDAIVRAWTALNTYRGEASFEGWLCRIALNAAHDYHRSAWKRRVFLWDRTADMGTGSRSEHEAGISPTRSDSGQDASLTAPSPHVEAERRETQRRIRSAVAALSEKERVPIWLIYFEEFSLAEVARLEGVPESTVRSRVKVGLTRLQRQLKDLALPEPDSNNSGHCEDSDNNATGGASRGQWKGCSA
jgi:RNA polymerase sigma-70 factor (ECF subfamily)